MFSFLRIFSVFLISFISFFLIQSYFDGAYSSNLEISITIILFSLFSSLVVWRINRIRVKLIAKQTDSFGSVLDNLGEGVLVASTSGDITYANENMLKIFEIKSVKNKNINDLKINALKNMFKNALKDGLFQYEFQIQGESSNPKWLLGSINRSKTTNEIILVINDVTELRANASMRRDFISNLSHELRTPVSVISANAETLMSGAIDNKKDAKTFSKAILHNAERISGLVTDLIDLSRIDYGEIHLDLTELNVCDVVSVVKDSHYSSAKRKGININFIEKNLPNVLADEAAVERIMTNLLDNAIKYTKANDEGEVEIEVKKEKDFIKVLVKDLGIGIQSSDQGQVFKRFYRTPDARASQKTGSGLGLAIVKNLTISLGGQVGVMKRRHKGSVNQNMLPLFLLFMTPT